jgi:DNA-3-methyladenine glycosylase I
MNDDNLIRCPWGPNGGELMQHYHDEEWGKPVHDDSIHFEFLVLEMFQAGLSWLTVLKKREAFRKAFAGFDPVKVSKLSVENRTKLLNDTGIIRNRLKIEAVVNNAVCFLETQKEFGSFDRYIWGFTGGNPVMNAWKDMSNIPPRTELSDHVSADLKKRGFKFAGSKIVYAHLQATGVVNDHITACFRYPEVAADTGRTKTRE